MTPLFKLLKKGKEFEWTKECEAAFTKIKGKIITAPILVQHNPDKEMTIKTNASDYVIRMRMTQPGPDGKP
jgi:hypothetical protein